MLGANRFRDEGFLGRKSERQATRSLEAYLALGLCAIVLFSSMALLRRASSLSRALEELQDESLGGRPEQPKSRGWLRGAGARPELVILISMDGLRPDRLGLHGYARATTPHLDRLGAEAVVFRNACAQASQPLASLKSLLTGKYPSTLLLQETGADLIELAAVQTPRDYLISALSRVDGLLAQGFRARSYRTAGITDGPWVNRRGGFQRGFEALDEAGGGLEAILPRALAWLETNAAAPSFLFLQAGDLSYPYHARAPFGGTFCRDHEAHATSAASSSEGRPRATRAGTELSTLSDHYDGDILSVDDHLGGFFDELRRRGLYDRALIVVTSAYGESLGERDQFGHGGLGLEQLLVPLVLKFPRAWNLPAARIEEPVELADLMPTLFSLCGIPAAADIDGRSLLPLILHGIHGRDYLLAETTLEERPGLDSSAAKRTLIRPGRWQVVQDAARQTAIFFALHRDPAGLEPRPIPQRELAHFLEVLLARSKKAARLLPRPSAALALDSELQQELFELGYGTSGEALAGEQRPTALR